jgi:hypothetical protein
MAKVNVKQIKQDCDEMSAGWEQSVDTEFYGIRKVDFDAERLGASTLDSEIEADEAALKAKKDQRDDRYRRLNQMRVNIGKGVAGHKDFGDDHPLYGAMGFVRKSERRSGLKRGTKNDNNDGGSNP